LNEEDGMTVILIEQKLNFERQVCKEFRLKERGCAVAMGEMSELSYEIVGMHLAVLILKWSNRPTNGLTKSYN